MSGNLFSNSYFLKKINKLRLIISRLEGYLPMAELMLERQNIMVKPINQNQGHEK